MPRMIAIHLGAEGELGGGEKGRENRELERKMGHLREEQLQEHKWHRNRSLQETNETFSVPLPVLAKVHRPGRSKLLCTVYSSSFQAGHCPE